jgi:helicase
MFRGLFIGIDRYAAPVNRLSCAVADAFALSSLFADNTAGQFVTLLDSEATLARMQAELDLLSHTDEDDFVLVSFSGHGSDDHRLVPSDVDVGDLPSTCMSLDELAERLDAIPARQLFVILDCCFSGGFGGSRFFAPSKTRGPLVENRDALVRLARGDGRIVLAASGAGEPALETVEYGHGLLTYHLVRALQGPAELIDNGRIDFLGMTAYVSRRVLDSAKLMGEEQNPSLYGSTDGAPSLPILVPGRAYARAFPGRIHPRVDTNWSSLEPRGIPADVAAMWEVAMPSPNELQREAINEYGVLDGESLMVVSPTGSGKTTIGEMAAVQHAARGSRTVMLLPLRALVNDKYENFSSVYGDRYSIIRATGEISDQVGDLLSGHFDLALLTYEKFLALVIGFPFMMRGVSLVVVDEAQNISDPSRGAGLEFLLTLLRSGYARAGAPQIIALSAVIGNTNGLERWMDARLLKSDVRPVPLRESVIDAGGNARHALPDGSETVEPYVRPEFGGGSQSSKPVVVPLVRRLVAEGKKVIVFREIKGETVGTAFYLAQALAAQPAESAIRKLPAGDLSVSSSDLRRVLQHGVGFHNSDLDRDERRALEDAFRDSHSDLRVLVATTTLAMGINTPAEAVVIVGLMHPGNQPYSVAEYKNMAGRAGRPGFSTAGESYVVAASRLSPYEAWNRYIQGNPEDITSHFLAATTDPQTLILRALAALGGSVEEPELLALLENSFAVWQMVDRGSAHGWDQQQLQHDVSNLIDAELIDREPTGNLTLTQLGRFAGESGLEVRSVTNVSSALRWVQTPLTAADLVLLSQVTVEMGQTYIPLNKRSRQEQARWPQVLVGMGAQRSLLNAMHVGGTDEPLPRMKRAAACMLFASATPISAIEGNLMQHLRETSVAGPVRAVAARTRDVISTVALIAAVKGVQTADEALADDITLMLEFGLPRDLVHLAGNLGNSLTRAQYLLLLNAGLTTDDLVRGAQPELVGGILGEQLAMAIQTQLGEQDPEG